MKDGRRRVAVLWRGDPAREFGKPDAPLRYPAVLEALAEAAFVVHPMSFSEGRSSELLDELGRTDAVLVWIDPISDGKDRSVLDRLLREVATRGTLVFTHPDTILKMGTKDVLYDTQALSWSLDTDRYETLDALASRLPAKLADGSSRVLKQHRGNGGIGVWKVQAIEGARRGKDVRVQHAAPRDGTTEELPMAEFLERMTPYFDNAGHLIDQAFATRVSEGMVRAYLVKGSVVGFARQYADRGDAERPVVPAERVFGIPAAKVMREPNDVEFASLRQNLEAEWVPGLQRLLNVSDQELPLLWDSDFLFGPADDAGQSSYLLCEINVSCVSPFPPGAPRQLAESLARQLDQSN